MKFPYSWRNLLKNKYAKIVIVMKLLLPWQWKIAATVSIVFISNSGPLACEKLSTLPSKEIAFFLRNFIRHCWVGCANLPLSFSLLEKLKTVYQLCFLSKKDLPNLLKYHQVERVKVLCVGHYKILHGFCLKMIHNQ